MARKDGQAVEVPLQRFSHHDKFVDGKGVMRLIVEGVNIRNREEGSREELEVKEMAQAEKKVEAARQVAREEAKLGRVEAKKTVESMDYEMPIAPTPPPEPTPMAPPTPPSGTPVGMSAAVELSMFKGNQIVVFKSLHNKKFG